MNLRVLVYDNGGSVINPTPRPLTAPNWKAEALALHRPGTTVLIQKYYPDLQAWATFATLL